MHKRTRSTGRPSRRKPAVSRAARAARKPIEFHYWPTPNGWKISIMLEECGLPYRMIPLNIARGDQFSSEFLRISPNNRMPAIVDPDGPGGRPISVFESGAILQYLGRKTGRFYPAAERARVEVEQWLFWQMANLGPKAGEASHFRTYKTAKTQLYAAERFDNELLRLFGVMNKRLEDRAYLAGPLFDRRHGVRWLGATCRASWR
jgi:GSH-dependent disulfide-bond oxidoreductase